MPGGKPAEKAPAAPPKKVDINNASLAELKTLPTVGDAEAKKIIAHRPYKAKGELMTKAGLPEGVYQAVKYKVELQTPRKAAATK
jgi:DNA uptake protein ComE-like DNA-binding protein